MIVHGLMGDQFTLADLNLAPFIARLDGLQLVEPWLEERHNARTWWQAVKSRPTYIEARLGPSADEVTTMAVEGSKFTEEFKSKRAEYLSQYG